MKLGLCNRQVVDKAAPHLVNIDMTGCRVLMNKRLRGEPYFGDVYHLTMHRMRALANRRKLLFESFGLGTRLQKITGI
ncbi:MAG TPA: hypothetical protein VL572_00605 [Pyrinomonadaceae bacterium]|nr:hypothetical protein [Pyrinomonadaceae bacterium]